VLVFVPRKIDSKWLPRGQKIRTALQGPNRLSCPVDVIEGNRDETLVKVVDEENPKQDLALPWSILQGPSRLSAEQLRLKEKLQGWTKKITPGAQIGGKDSNGTEFTGALGFFAKSQNKEFGFVTNHHIADHVGNLLYFPWFGARPCGIVSHSVDVVPADVRFNNLIKDANAFWKLDCAFVVLHRLIRKSDFDVRLAVMGRYEDVTMKQIGEPVHLDLGTMGALGRKVLSIGPKRSLQRGTIYGFAYEYKDENGRRFYTDHLIVGDDDKEFSTGGDSGKLIVTDDAELRPLALLWGGRRQRLRSEHEQEKWAYAVDINMVLSSLHIQLMK
jgi:hypothetical protein